MHSYSILYVSDACVVICLRRNITPLVVHLFVRLHVRSKTIRPYLGVLLSLFCSLVAARIVSNREPLEPSLTYLWRFSDGTAVRVAFDLVQRTFVLPNGHLIAYRLDRISYTSSSCL